LFGGEKRVTLLVGGGATFKLEGGVILGRGAAIIPASGTLGPLARGDCACAPGIIGWEVCGSDGCLATASLGTSGEWGATNSCF